MALALNSTFHLSKERCSRFPPCIQDWVADLGNGGEVKGNSWAFFPLFRIGACNHHHHMSNCTFYHLPTSCAQLRKTKWCSTEIVYHDYSSWLALAACPAWVEWATFAQVLAHPKVQTCLCKRHLVGWMGQPAINLRNSGFWKPEIEGPPIWGRKLGIRLRLCWTNIPMPRAVLWEKNKEHVLCRWAEGLGCCWAACCCWLAIHLLSPLLGK